MSEEIWDLTEARQRMYMQELERCKNEDCDFYLEHNNVNEFYDYITNLQEELKSANESITWWTNRFNAVAKENERLNNIINELEEWLSYEWYEMSKDINPEEVLDKLKELKEGKRSEK